MNPGMIKAGHKQADAAPVPYTQRATGGFPHVRR